MKYRKSQFRSSDQIRNGALMSYITMAFFILSGLIYTPWMIKQIGQSDYGLYSLALTIISFFTIDFGLGEAVSKFLSKYNAEGNEEKKKNFLGITFKIYLVIDLLIILLMIGAFFLTDSIYGGLDEKELIKFKIVFIIAGLYSAASFPFIPLNGILISYERFVFLQFTNLFNKILTVITMVLVLLLENGLYSLVSVNALVGFFTIIFKLHYIKKHNLIKINLKSNDINLLKEIFSFSSWMATISIAQRFIINITPTVIAAFTGSIQVSLFALAMTIEGYIYTFSNALNGLFLPKISRVMLKEKNAINEVENIMIKVGRIQLILLGLIFILFILLGEEFIELWIGNTFSDSYYMTLLLIAPLIITMTQQIANTALIAVNKVKYRAYCYLFAVVVSLGLSLILTPQFGALGSSLSIFIGNFLGLVIGLNIVYYKVLKINIIMFFRECHIKLSLPMLIVFICSYFFDELINSDTWILLVLKGTIISMLYIVIIWNLSLNDFEKNTFKSVLTKFLR